MKGRNDIFLDPLNMANWSLLIGIYCALPPSTSGIQDRI